jgi:hypothetical protein
MKAKEGRAGRKRPVEPGPGRPPWKAEGDKFVPYTVRLRPDQVAWLREHWGAADIVRGALDREMKRKA